MKRKMRTTMMKGKTVMKKVVKIKANSKMPMMEANLDLLNYQIMQRIVG